MHKEFHFPQQAMHSFCLSQEARSLAGLVGAAMLLIWQTHGRMENHFSKNEAEYSKELGISQTFCKK